MNDTELERVVRSVLATVAPEVDIDDVEAGADLHEELDIDSMDFLNFVIGLNQVTGVEVPERDYRQLATIDGCVDYLQRHRT